MTDIIDEGTVNSIQASKLCTNAGVVLPDDEEDAIGTVRKRHIDDVPTLKFPFLLVYLKGALTYLPNGKTPVKQHLGLMERIPPKVQAILSNSELAIQGRDTDLFQIMRREMDILRTIREGNYGLNFTGPF
ncbi:hypothetical protein AMATHDRAFT_45765 [Amanita thiersii Skay4041]|uniref:Uncharacterized protein n=1 Tax=Amanita thiersii Skay4041 TaxID=703135 RepID=A0A2A9NZ34_9AGAR|nr:hypothetical protein AMATHDRAFT_45765 [Amanita thiersii Skay4041]